MQCIGYGHRKRKKSRLERIIFSSPAPLIKATCERQRWTCKKEKRQRNRSRSKIKHSRLGEGYHIASFILRFVHGRNNERHVAVRASAEESEKISSNRRKERERGNVANRFLPIGIRFGWRRKVKFNKLNDEENRWNSSSFFCLTLRLRAIIDYRMSRRLMSYVSSVVRIIAHISLVLFSRAHTHTHSFTHHWSARWSVVCEQTSCLYLFCSISEQNACFNMIWLILRLFLKMLISKHHTPRRHLVGRRTAKDSGVRAPVCRTKHEFNWNEDA